VLRGMLNLRHHDAGEWHVAHRVNRRLRHGDSGFAYSNEHDPCDLVEIPGAVRDAQDVVYAGEVALYSRIWIDGT
jgi:hypothetical protein